MVQREKTWLWSHTGVYNSKVTKVENYIFRNLDIWGQKQQKNTASQSVYPFLRNRLHGFITVLNSASCDSINVRQWVLPRQQPHGLDRAKAWSTATEVTGSVDTYMPHRSPHRHMYTTLHISFYLVHCSCTSLPGLCFHLQTALVFPSSQISPYSLNVSLYAPHLFLSLLNVRRSKRVTSPQLWRMILSQNYRKQNQHRWRSEKVKTKTAGTHKMLK